MTDDPNKVRPDAGQQPARPEGEETPRAAAHESETPKEPSSSSAIESAGALPPPPDAERPRPTPESQAALTGKAPSGSSDARTTTPASPTGPAETGGVKTPPPATAPGAPPNETPEEKKARLARIIAEAKAKKEAAAQAAGAEGSAQAPPGGETPAAAAGAPKPPVKKKEEGPKPEDASGHPLVARLRGRFPEGIPEATTFLRQLSVRVAAASIVEVCRALRDDSETPFDFLSDLTCVHWPAREGEQFEVVYNLYSISKNDRVRLKVWADAAAGVESVTSVWPTADWMEREVFDLFGVRFNNHPDLRRLLLPEDWQGHPLRKDYPLAAMENEWTAKHLPEFTEVQREQLDQRRAYGLELLSTADERRIRDIFRAGRDPMPLDRK